MMEDNDGDANAIPIQHIKHFLETLAKGAMGLLGNLPKELKGSKIETQILQNLYSIRVRRGLIHCNFVVPESLSDGDGRWRAGAIATLIEIIGACAVYTSVGNSVFLLNSMFLSSPPQTFTKKWRLKLRYWDIKEIFLHW
ncbi:hypothetical protein MKW98_011875 [Papaver atlanticum]|uniref:Uncharacterized protein n=1 Tax=Papaver atlanticum TaxID=357466 RepID=A0AAD4T342_9MAGN|nr:hypothetical protein MKW98_011875 [Papaver atlanticum]